MCQTQDCVTQATDSKSMTEVKRQKKRPVTASNRRYQNLGKGTHIGKESWYEQNLDLQIQKL